MDSGFGWLLTIVGASWAAFNTSMTIIKHVNALRDQIFARTIDDLERDTGGNTHSNAIRQTYLWRLYHD